MNPSEPKIAFRSVGMRYGAGARLVQALRGVDFDVRAREFICLVGPSGCGKSTLLHLAAGFLSPSEGSILIDGRPIRGPGVDRGVVFQRHTLFPWETVAGNVGFGPRLRGLARARQHALVARFLDEVGLAAFAAHYPQELSAGMQQRVGLARAFANEPDILLMDEPFVSLDALTRLQMQEMLLEIWGKHQSTVLFVTHDVEEALLLADRVLVLSPRPGRVLRELSVDLPRRRSRSQLAQPRFIALKEEILSQLSVSPRT